MSHEGQHFTDFPLCHICRIFPSWQTVGIDLLHYYNMSFLLWVGSVQRFSRHRGAFQLKLWDGVLPDPRRGSDNDSELPGFDQDLLPEIFLTPRFHWWSGGFIDNVNDQRTPGSCPWCALSHFLVFTFFYLIFHPVFLSAALPYSSC